MKETINWLSNFFLVFFRGAIRHVDNEFNLCLLKKEGLGFSLISIIRCNKSVDFISKITGRDNKFEFSYYK